MIHLAALLLQVAGAQPANGEALLDAMHDRWHGNEIQREYHGDVKLNVKFES